MCQLSDSIFQPLLHPFLLSLDRIKRKPAASKRRGMKWNVMKEEETKSYCFRLLGSCQPSKLKSNSHSIYAAIDRSMGVPSMSSLSGQFWYGGITLTLGDLAVIS